MEELTKFVHNQYAKITLKCDSAMAKFSIPDVQAELCDQLCEIAKLPECRKVGQVRFSFEISSNEQNVTDKDPYTIEILIDENGRGKLGKSKLPEPIKLQKILSQIPIDDLSNVRYFLESCKHYVYSYHCRLKQLEEFKDLLSGIRNIQICANDDITGIQFLTLEIKDLNTGKFHKVIVYLSYQTTSIRPFNLIVETDWEELEEPSPILIKKLERYFEPFLKESLSLAAQQVSESQTMFKWFKNKL